MTLPVRATLEVLADELGVTLPDLTDDEVLSIAEIMVRENGTTFSASFLQLNEIVNRVIDRRIVGEAGGHRVVPAAVENAPASPAPCCEGRVYPGPSGVVRRHTCRGRRGEPYAAQVVELADRRPRHVHPACKAAWTDGATPCWRCLPILCEDDDCDHDACLYHDAHMDDDDDTPRRGRWATS